MNSFYFFLVLILSSIIFGCNDSRFDDKDGLTIYFPQLEDNSIDDLVIYIEDSKGNIVSQSHYLAPFTNQSGLANGTITMMLPPREYSITVFANTISTEGSLVTQNRGRAQFSSISLNEFKSGQYTTSTELRRVLRAPVMNNITCNMQVADTISLDEQSTYVGSIEYQFSNLDPSVANIQISTYGLNSQLYFDGREKNGNPSDAVVISAEVISWDKFSVKGYYFPSAEVDGSKVGISILVEMFDQDGNKIESFTQIIHKATDPQGREVEATLDSFQQLIINFSGTSIGGVTISSWEDITSGGNITM